MSERMIQHKTVLVIDTGNYRSSRKTIEFAESFADGQATKNELHGKAWGKPGQAHPVVQRKAWDAAEGCADYAAGMIANAVLGLDEEKYKAWQSAWDSAWLQQGYRLSEAMGKNPRVNGRGGQSRALEPAIILTVRVSSLCAPSVRPPR